MATTAPPSDVHALVGLLVLGEYNVEVGREVVRALAAMGKRAVPVLADVLQRPTQAHGRVARMAAAWLLGRTGGRRALDALCSVQDDADPEVAAVARRTLQAQGHAPCRATVAA